MARVDLTVLGGGVFGLCCAFAAARRGARVRLVEAARIGAGASGGLVGALSPHVPEAWNGKKAFQLDSLLMGKAFWADVAAQGGQDPGYARSGRLQPLADARAVEMAQVRAEGAAVLWRGAAEWRVIASTGAAHEPPSPTGALVFDTLSARLAPRRAGAALAAALQALGGEIVPGEAEVPADGGAVLHATGHAGLLALNLAFGRTVGGGVRGQAASLLAPDLTHAPQVFAEGLHIVPHADGTVAVGSTSETDWTSPDATDGRLDVLIDRARALLPALHAAPVVDRWAGIRPRAVTRAPILGTWPGRPGHYVANGGFKIGFGMAPKVAQVMADLILDGKDAIPDDFRIETALVRQNRSKAQGVATAEAED